MTANLESSQLESHAIETSAQSHSADTSTLIFNIIFQIINLLIFFWIFKKLLADKILEVLGERKQLIDKLKNAEEEYQNILNNAIIEKNKIIEEGKTIKEQILSEGQQLATQKKSEIIEQANKKSGDIISTAQFNAKKIEQELTENWEIGIKNTVKLVTKKLLEEDMMLQERYLDKIVDQLKK